MKFANSLEAAVHELGVHEESGRNDGIPAERYMRGDELEWCAGFRLWCNEASEERALAPDTATYYRCRSVSGFIDEMKDRGMYFAKGTRACAPGDTIFFGGTTSDQGVKGNHVGIVEKIVLPYVHTIEGNTSNKVARRRYLLVDPTILGYARDFSQPG